MTADHPYTTQLGAGLGLVHETKVLLDLWTPDKSPPELKEAALQSGLFPGVTARRLRNMVIECFKPRYLADDARPARYLKALQPVLTPAEFNQLLFLYTCRANPILADFVRDVYWERYAAGAEMLTKKDAGAFIRRGVDDGKTIKRWSDNMIVRVSNYLLGACADYGLLGKLGRSGRKILPFRIEPKIAAYLAHDLHFKGVGDSSLLAHDDWALFGLQQEDVRSELKRLTLRAQIILQSAGSVTQIGWKYKGMEDFVDALSLRPPGRPTSEASLAMKRYLKIHYPNSRNDLLAIFVERGLTMVRRGARLGAITSRTCFYLSSFQKWRQDIVLDQAYPDVIADLGLKVMDDAMVEASAYVLERNV